jgi:hypothetical protein
MLMQLYNNQKAMGFDSIKTAFGRTLFIAWHMRHALDGVERNSSRV